MSEKTDVRSKVIDRKLDTSLIVVVVFLVSFGLVMIYSTSSYEASLNGLPATYYLNKQLFATAMGLAAMTFFAMMDYHRWKKYAVFAYFVVIVCILLVLSPIGIESNGAKRWIGVGGFSFQPAELAKLTMILFFAVIISKKPMVSSKLKTSGMMLVYAGVVAGLLATVTSNLSSAVIVGGIAYIMLAVTSKNTKAYVLLAVVLVTLVAIYIMFFGGYRMQRVLVWQNPELYSKEGGYQTLQALYALSSGGMFGKGLGQSVQKLGFVPEAQNDMIFSIICEELGLFGGIAIIVLFAFMIWRLLVIANHAEDLFGSLIAIGVLIHISLQVVLNIAVVTNTIPNTGITLPFISYGGTSTLFIMIEMGLALSVSRGSKKSKRKRVILDED